MPSKDFSEALRIREKQLHESISQHYEELMKDRLAATRLEMHKKLREEIDSELRIEYLA